MEGKENYATLSSSHGHSVSKGISVYMNETEYIFLGNTTIYIGVKTSLISNAKYLVQALLVTFRRPDNTSPM